jgi:hypothetical protein
MNTGDARNIDAIGTITTVTSVTTRSLGVVETGENRCSRGFMGTAGDSGDSGDRGRQRVEAEKRCTSCREVKHHHAFLRTRYSPTGVTDNCRDCIFSNAQRDREQRERRSIKIEDRRRHARGKEEGLR